MDNIKELDKDLPLLEGDKETAFLLAKLAEARAKQGKREGPNVIWLNEIHDDSVVRFPSYTLQYGPPTLNQTLTDFECGIAAYAGLPNAGKSTLLTNMLIDCLKNNPDIMVIDLSFDDDPGKRYQQWIAALTGLRYQQITTRTPLTDAQQYAYDQADLWLQKMIQEDRFRPYEGEYPVINSAGEIVRTLDLRRLEHIVRLMGTIRRKYPTRKIAFFVDAWQDVYIPSSRNRSENTEASEAVNLLKKYSQDYEVMVHMSCHLRKTQGRKATLEDFKGTGGLGYAAVYAAVCRNELRENSSTDPLVYEDEENRIWPILIVDTVKNKVGGWSEPLFYPLMMDRCTLIKINEEHYRRLLEHWTGRSI